MGFESIINPKVIGKEIRINTFAVLFISSIKVLESFLSTRFVHLGNKTLVIEVSNVKTIWLSFVLTV